MWLIFQQEDWWPNTLPCKLNSRPRKRAFGAHRWNTHKSTPNKHVKQEWCETSGKYLTKMTEDLNDDLFWGPKWPGNWASEANIYTPLNIPQIDMLTKTDGKPVENFWKKWPKTGNFTYLRAQGGHFSHTPESMYCMPVNQCSWSRIKNFFEEI